MVPEILNDDLYNEIVYLVSEKRPKTILEIGSAEGTGSTKAFVEGIENAWIENECKLFCLETVKDRFSELVSNHSGKFFVYPVNMSSVALNEFFTEEYVNSFLKAHPEFTISKLYEYEAVKWLRGDLGYIEKNGILDCGVRYIKHKWSIENFDIVLIDGSAFTGYSDYENVKGSGVIILDDVLDIKCYDAWVELKESSEYNLIKEDLTLRNGYAIFERVK